MSAPNKFYKTECVIETRNCGRFFPEQISLILAKGGIDEIIKWAVRANVNFDHDLDKSVMTLFSVGDRRDLFHRFKVVEVEAPVPEFFIDDDAEAECQLHRIIWAECQEEMIGRLETLRYDVVDTLFKQGHNAAITEAQNQIRI